MPLSEDEKVEMRQATIEMAAALLDDLSHIKEILEKRNLTVGDVRRLSGLLRRILVERTLARVASPRMGRIELLTQDIKPVHVSSRSAPPAFFCAGGATIYGVTIAGMMLERAGNARELPGYDPEATAKVRIDNFLSQEVICFEGRWIKRGDIIKHIANVAHGVHSGIPKDEIDRLIARVRHCANVRIDGTVAHHSLNLAPFHATSLPPLLDPEAPDCVLVEVFSSAHYLVISPDVHRLEELIEEEISSRTKKPHQIL